MTIAQITGVYERERKRLERLEEIKNRSDIFQSLVYALDLDPAITEDAIFREACYVYSKHISNLFEKALEEKEEN